MPDGRLRRRFRAISPVPWLLLAAFLVGLAVRVLFAWPALAAERGLFGDEGDYISLGHAIRHDHVFALDGAPTARRLPLFPALLAAVYVFDDRPFAAMPLIVVLNTALCGGAYLLGVQLFDRRVGAVAALLAAVDLNLAWYAGAVLSETLYLVLALTSLLALVEARRRQRWHWLILAGVLCGLAVLTRPNFAPLIPVAVGWTLITWGGERRQALAAAALVLVTLLVVWVPWSIRNAVVFGQFIPFTSQPCPPCGGIYRDGAADPTDLRAFAGWSYLPPPPDLDELAGSRYRLDRAVTWIRERPVTAATIALIQAPLLWRPTGLGLGPWAAGAWLAYGALLVMALRGLSEVPRHRRQDLLLWIATACALTAFAVLTIGDPRHRLIVHPLLNVLAAAVLARAWHRPRHGARPSVSPGQRSLLREEARCGEGRSPEGA